MTRTQEIKDKVAECLAGMDYSDVSPWARQKIGEAIDAAARAILARDIEMVLRQEIDIKDRFDEGAIGRLEVAREFRKLGYSVEESSRIALNLNREIRR